MNAKVKIKKHCERFRIEDICDVIKGVTPTMKAIPGKYPLVVTAKNRKSCNNFQFDGEAICIPLVSSTGHGHASINRIHIEYGKFALANIMVALIPKDPKNVFSTYLYYLFNTKKEEYFVSLMRGTANVSLKIQDIKNVIISLPSIDEQKKTVSKIEQFLSDFNEAKLLLEELRIYFRNYVQSLLKSIFENDINQKQSIESDSKKHDSKILQECISQIIGGDWGKTPSDKIPENFVLVRVIRGVDITKWKTEKGKNIELRIIKKNSLDKRILKAGDIIFEISGGSSTFSVGRTFLIDNEILQSSSVPLICNNFFRKIRFDEKLVPKFTKYYLDYLYELNGMKPFITQTTNLQNFNITKFLSKTNIKFPNKNIQKEIIQILDKNFTLINDSQNYIDTQLQDLELMKISMLKQSFDEI